MCSAGTRETETARAGTHVRDVCLLGVPSAILSGRLCALYMGPIPLSARTRVVSAGRAPNTTMRCSRVWTCPDSRWTTFPDDSSGYVSAHRTQNSGATLPPGMHPRMPGFGLLLDVVVWALPVCDICPLILCLNSPPPPPPSSPSPSPSNFPVHRISLLSCGSIVWRNLAALFVLQPLALSLVFSRECDGGSALAGNSFGPPLLERLTPDIDEPIAVAPPPATAIEEAKQSAKESSIPFLQTMGDASTKVRSLIML